MGSETRARSSSTLSRFLSVLLLLAVLLGPLWLFADPLRTYRLHSDDFAYLGASRSFDRAVENLFVPHNTHIVPAWRLLTWAVARLAGNLANLPRTLAIAAYGALVITMLLVGRIVSRETGRSSIGLAAMVAMGTTSLLKDAASWYSAGQTLWAGIAILGMLVLLQDWRRAGGAWRLALAALAAWAAGSFWTIGHAAGPVGAIYLWADGRPRCRKAALVPIGATAVTVALALFLGGRHINGTVSFHGRTSKEALDMFMGMSHTLQAIPENLVLGNLGVVAETTVPQGVALSLVVLAIWAWTTCSLHHTKDAAVRSAPWWLVVAFGLLAMAGLLAVGTVSKHFTFLDVVVYASFMVLGTIVLSPRAAPLERAGALLVLASYFVEWSFRGYLPFSSLRGVVPWYDAIPQIGAVLFISGWWARPSPPAPVASPEPVTRSAALAILAFEVAMLIVHQPRADALFIEGVPRMTEAEAKILPTPELQKLRANYLADEFARWQHRHLVRLDRAEAAARRLGIGREGIANVFGRINMPELPKVYDAAPLLDLPWKGTENDPAVIRPALGPYFTMEPEPVFPLEELHSNARYH